jgi:hypothetical protein
MAADFGLAENCLGQRNESSSRREGSIRGSWKQLGDQSCNRFDNIEAAKALLQNKDASTAIADIAALPLEKRYVWRVASALKWGFADFDSGSVAMDRETLSPEDRETVAESLKLRPMQFCLFLKALLGEEEMHRLMKTT